MNVVKDLTELIEAGIISEETANNIREYYISKHKKSSTGNRLVIVFGILGAILIGLGIILIIAHNWDEFSKGTKTIFAFLPPLAGQLICGYVLLHKLEKAAWREGSSAYLFFAIGASIALVSQIYHIPGGTGTFILTWMLLSLPLVYLMNSSVTSLLYLSGITYYAIDLSYWTYPYTDSYLYWLLLAGILPHYYYLYKKKPQSNSMIFHNWMVPISLTITLGTLAGNSGELMYIAYVSLFGLFFLIGTSDFFARHMPSINFFKIAGYLGTIFVLLMLSFDYFWEELRRADLQFNKIIYSPEFIASTILTVLAAVVLYFNLKKKSINELEPVAPVFILFIITYIIGLNFDYTSLLINIYIMAIGLITIRDGALNDRLGKMNIGLLIITALVISRFFDSDLSFIIRGILFLAVGTGFFAANYIMLKKRRLNE